MQKPCFFKINTLLCIISLSTLTGCERASKTPGPAASTPSAVSSGPPAKLTQFPDDPDKIAALEAAGFTLTRNSDGLVTELSIVSDEPITEALPNLNGVPNTQIALFSGPGVTDDGMEALAELGMLKRADFSNSEGEFILI